jgi:hypothetical protein
MLYYMFKNPPTMRKLQKEIKEMEEKGLISDPITYQQSCKMPYLQALMKAAMRFLPFRANAECIRDSFDFGARRSERRCISRWTEIRRRV